MQGQFGVCSAISLWKLVFFCPVQYCLSVSWWEVAEKLSMTQVSSDPVPAVLVAFCLGKVPGLL